MLADWCRFCEFNLVFLHFSADLGRKMSVTDIVSRKRRVHDDKIALSLQIGRVFPVTRRARTLLLHFRRRKPRDICGVINKDVERACTHLAVRAHAMLHVVEVHPVVVDPWRAEGEHGSRQVNGVPIDVESV